MTPNNDHDTQGFPFLNNLGGGGKIAPDFPKKVGKEFWTQFCKNCMGG